MTYHSILKKLILQRIANYNLEQEFFGWEGGFSELHMPFPGIKKRRALL